jgi:hypothetical protein
LKNVLSSPRAPSALQVVGVLAKDSMLADWKRQGLPFVPINRTNALHALALANSWIANRDRMKSN